MSGIIIYKPGEAPGNPNPNQRYCPECENLIYGGYCECDDGLCNDPSCIRPAIIRLTCVDLLGIKLSHLMTCKEHLPKMYHMIPIKYWEYCGI